MVFFKKAHNFMKTPLAALLTLVVFFGLSSIAFGQRPTPVGGGSTSTGGTTILNPGNGTSERPKTAKIRGWAWMGTDVDMENPNQSEGGGGWLNFNCDPGFCNGALSNQQGTEEVIPLGGGGGPFSSGGNDGREQNETLPVSGQWGVSADIDRESNTYGHMTGQAWSSNYGWLTLEEDIVSSCWNANPAETSAGPAKILFGENETVARIVGWGKFVNGDDGSLDGYDGCVSFSGSEYGVYIDLQTGDLRGWAWGGPVVGWISFTNDVCPYCNTSIDLDDTVSINFWAEDETVNPGGSTVLRWEATDNGANYVRECPTYSNTSNYSHWRSNSLFGSSTNFGEISTDIGNLPTGSHPISNITQTTNYQLHCIDANGNTLPPRYAIVTVQTGGIGCMDPLASNYDSTATVPGRCLYDNGCTDPLAMNYNPSATVDDGSCLYRERELIQLTANPTTIVVNSGSSGYPVELQWVKSLPAANVNSCTGTFRNNLSTQNINLSGWSGVSLANPNSQTTVTLPSNLGVVNRTYRFDITCIGSQGQTLTDNALVTFIDDSGPGGGVHRIVLLETLQPLT
ncbi:MAG: hypothetical protein R3B65_02370 [Candidatus Paceibacterota bacterium]